ncbi:DUF4928 family protein [Actinocorallia sp. API 0066]|uniref:DUF4928 family protein n=1 Tax=Actinocorallia sp. API 0066 TaxID=2896846 RepID=UPI001E300007|nr:DUF4928 family protein [Actinocorallia sp. API 0066]MCD0450404.1 DUF4928 family protein [Actinocorallia sp. API 0066]
MVEKVSFEVEDHVHMVVDSMTVSVESWYESKRDPRGEGGVNGNVLAAGLYMTDFLAEYFPLKEEQFLTETQVKGAGYPRAMRILGQHGETRPFLKEGGRTSRATRKHAKELADVLNNSGAEADLGQLSPKDRKIVASLLQQWFVEKTSMDFYSLQSADPSGTNMEAASTTLFQEVPAQGSRPESSSVGFDPMMDELSRNPTLLSTFYRENPDQLRELITNDATGKDVIAVAHRRQQVERFEKLLYDDAFFDLEKREAPHGAESVWQKYFEDNPWILGISLTGQLLTSWDEGRLEQVVAGQSVAGAGKRADALMRTSGRIRSLVFAEIKTHRTELQLNGPYRPGCFAPSKELSGGVAQSQMTVYQAVRQIGEKLDGQAEDGSSDPLQDAYLIRPRSFLVIGTTEQLTGAAGGVHTERWRSFELYRNHITHPEIVTFDELLAKARWSIS